LPGTSISPWKDRTINFMIITARLFSNLPGTVYAKISKTEQEKGELIEEYLKIQKRTSIKI
jgi:GTP-binding protein EngB required for normal cell division